VPFTAAHPLAVVPLVRARWLDATCLVIGSMAPDFEYFVRAQQVSTISHTARGLWLWDLPVTLALAAVFHALVVWPMVMIAPPAIARRLVGGIRWRWRAAAIGPCVISALIGGATHLAWDAFTHAQGWGPQHYRVLKQPIALPLVGPMAAHRVLQHASTVIGLVVLMIVVIRAVRRGRPVALPDVRRAGPRGLVAGCVLALAGLAVARLVGKHATDPGDLIVGVIAGALAGVIVASAIVTPRAQRFRRAIATSP